MASSHKNYVHSAQGKLKQGEETMCCSYAAQGQKAFRY